MVHGHRLREMLEFTNKPKLIFGTGELARMLYGYCNEVGAIVLGFTVESNYIIGQGFQGKSVSSFTEIENIYNPKNVDMLIGVTFTGNLLPRKRIYYEALGKGYNIPSFIHPDAYISNEAVIEKGCIILENNTIQSGVVIDENTILWSGNHIGHRTKIGKHNFISSHVVLAEAVETEERVFIGINTAVAPYVKIREGATIGMGLSILKNVESNSLIRGRDSRDV